MITNHVNFQIGLTTPSISSAGFGTPMLIHEHSITANRQDGPYSSVAALAAAGFTLAATPTIYNQASQIFAQRPRATQVLVGRRAASEHIVTTLNAIEAANPGSWFASLVPLNTAAEILAVAGWHESRSKIAVLQSSSADMLAGTASTAQVTNFRFGGTPTDGTYSIAVRNAWTNALIGTASVPRVAGSPATNNDLATAMRAAWDLVPALAAISSPAAGATNNVLITFDGLGNLYTFTITDPESPDGLTVQLDTPGIQNPGELGSGLAYNNSSLWYHDDDTEYLDSSIAGRCLGFALDAPLGSGSWAHHQLSGIPSTRLSDAETTTLLGYNVNWYSPLTYTAGNDSPGFTFPGRMLSGRSIKVQTTLHWLRARLEEAALNVFLSAAGTTQPAVLFTDVGIAKFQAAFKRVFARGVLAGHFSGGAVSESTGRTTPWVDVPSAASVSAADKAAGRLTGITAEAILAPEILSVGDAATVGFTINLGFT